MRARNIKPSFFSDEALCDCPPLTRLLFIGMWCVADREGRLEDKPRQLKLQLLPSDDIEVDEALNELAANGRIIRYEVKGKRYIQIVNFLKHQNPHHREAASLIPAQGKPRASLGQAQGKPRASLGKAVLIPDSLIPDSLIPERERLLTLAKEIPGWTIRPTDRDIFDRLCDLHGEEKMKRTLHALATRQIATGEYTDLRKALGNWLNHDRGGSNGGRPKVEDDDPLAAIEGIAKREWDE